MRFPNLSVFVLLGGFVFSSTALQSQSDWVWWEGEAAFESNFPKETWLSGSRVAKREALSKGDWLTYDGKHGKKAPFARWRVTVPSAGEWGLWCRKFWKHGPFQWRFDKGEWQICGKDKVLLDSVPLQKFVVANWVPLGKVKLGKGKHVFEIQLEGKVGESITAALDCFVLSKRGFQARGKLQPGAKSGRKEAGHWAFEPDPDGEKTALDLRYLNEEVAGGKGWVRRKGRELVRGDGKRIRFWGVNLGMDTLRQSSDGQKRLAGFLARRGVNLVRVHGAFWREDRIQEVDPDKLASLQSFVAACRSEGIYIALSFYFPLWLKLGKKQGWPEYEGQKNRHPFGLLFVDDKFRAVHRGWIRQLLTSPGAQGAKPLAQEPTLAIVEIQNEDSMLFWTFQKGSVPEGIWKGFERKFGAWLGKRHGSIAKAYKAWGGASQSGDDERGKRMTLLPPWNLTEKGRGQGALQRRMSDQLRFLVEVQRGFYADTVSWMRKELGVKALLSCSNWHTAEPKSLQALERWSYEVGDLVDAHGYFGGKHIGEGASYSIRPGHHYADRSFLRDLKGNPLLQAQYAERPFWISEIGWPGPNVYMVEFPFLASVLSSRQGFAGLCFFALHGSGSWEGNAQKFPLAVPSLLGQFPGFALLYRRGDLATPKPALVESLSLDRLFEFRGSLLARQPALDELRKKGLSLGKASSDQSLPAQWLGPVLWKITKKPGGIQNRSGLGFDENRFLDPQSGDALAMDTKRGLLFVDSPRAQGVVGFVAGAGRLELSDIGFECDNLFASLLAISLDGKPIRKSRRVLIQMCTREHPHGWNAPRGRIVDVGGPPMQVEHLQAELFLADARQSWKATTLDASGRRKETRKVRGKMKLPKDALYVLLER